MQQVKMACRVTVAVCALVVTASAAFAQGGRASNGRPGRTPDGQPDIQGVWTFATITPLERPSDLAGKAVLSDEEAAALEARNNVDVRNEKGTDSDVGRAYNQFWWDRGSKVVGNRRTSLVVDPADGKIPYTAAGAERVASAGPAFGGRRGSDGPEDRSLWERCITHSPLPRLSSGYNNNLQIVQGAGTVAIVYEMIHEVRVIPVDGRPHAGPGLRQWFGDSRGRWEGDTLVVETTNFSDKTSFRGATPQVRMVERFKREGSVLNYEFTIDDPATYTKPWTAAVPMPAVDGHMYEYACHETNYGMYGILSGARAQEREAAAAAKKGSR
jgi:hypothetical protein